MVDPSIRAGRQASRWAKQLHHASLGIVLWAALSVAGSLEADAQESAPSDVGKPAVQARVTRLQDSLDAGEDWHIGVPVVAPEPSTDSSFAGLIRAGRALDSEAYLALDGELRQVRQLLQARPEDKAVRQQLEELQDALVQRIEINLDFDYLYAAAVYIELFRQADGSPGTVRQFSRRLSERRSNLVD